MEGHKANDMQSKLRFMADGVDSLWFGDIDAVIPWFLSGMSQGRGLETNSHTSFEFCAAAY
jgi:hypothetical protein